MAQTQKRAVDATHAGIIRASPSPEQHTLPCVQLPMQLPMQLPEWQGFEHCRPEPQLSNPPHPPPPSVRRGHRTRSPLMEIYRGARGGRSACLHRPREPRRDTPPMSRASASTRYAAGFASLEVGPVRVARERMRRARHSSRWRRQRSAARRERARAGSRQAATSNSLACSHRERVSMCCISVTVSGCRRVHTGRTMGEPRRGRMHVQNACTHPAGERLQHVCQHVCQDICQCCTQSNVSPNHMRHSHSEHAVVVVVKCET